MSTLKEAIERFLEKQAQVYRADPDRLYRDAREAAGPPGITGDAGCWKNVPGNRSP